MPPFCNLTFPFLLRDFVSLWRLGFIYHMITLRNITKLYGERKVLNGVSFAAERKKITYIFGTSGGGKSTLLKIMVGALKPDSGDVLFGETDIAKFPDRELAPFFK